MSWTPYPFQQEDIDKLVSQGACLIGSEMGTGKTHEAIALDELWNADGKKPTLVVAPLNTFSSWQEKYSAQSPQTDVVVLDRKNRDEFVRRLGQRSRRGGDVFLLHWEALRLMPSLRDNNFAVIIADEVHRASNRKAQGTLALKRLRADHKLGLSGTASGDKPQNIWSILNWLYPWQYGSIWNFLKKYTIMKHEDDPSGRTNGYMKIVEPNFAALEELHAAMEPWYVRHLKKERCCDHHPNGVMSWLPDKTYDTIWVDLNPTQRRIYEQMRKEMVAWVNEHEDTPLVASVIVAQMTRLSQIALATPQIVEGERRVKNELFGLVEGEPKFVKVPYPTVELIAPSSKIDAVLELVKDHGNKQFVVFSSSKRALKLAHATFERAGVSSVVMSGDTPDWQRQDLTRGFAAGDFQVVFGVIQAVAEGVDGLQHTCDTAIFLDRSWSTIKNKQAEDRLHRDGQKNSVQIIDVCARNTLDWGRNQRLIEKWSWIRAVLGDIKGAQLAALANKLEEM